MNILIANGRSEADFLIGSLLAKRHRLVVINDDPAYCTYLAQAHNISVLNGDASKQYILDEAGISGFDLVIALGASDADNLIICQTAKKLYAVKKAVSVVSNPKSVEVFTMLGVNSAISAAYLVANSVEQASSIATLVQTLTLEQGTIVLTELLIDRKSSVCGKKIIDVAFPDDIIVSCILRGQSMVIPKGKTEICEGDTLIILSSPDRQAQAVAILSGKDR